MISQQHSLCLENCCIQIEGVRNSCSLKFIHFISCSVNIPCHNLFTALFTVIKFWVSAFDYVHFITLMEGWNCWVHESPSGEEKMGMFHPFSVQQDKDRIKVFYCLLLSFISLKIDFKECVNGTSRCMQLCNNTFGSYICSCKTGYTLDVDNHTCNGKVHC